MPAAASLLAVQSDEASSRGRIQDVIRNLIALIDDTSEGSPGQAAPDTPKEEVLVDTEVDGFRYLLVRMPRVAASRIQLSPREREIVRMVAKGHPNKVIADILNISSWTVCTHLRRIFAKLGVGSRAAMVAQLLDLGLLPAENRGFR